MTIPITDLPATQAALEETRAARQQQRVQKALNELPAARAQSRAPEREELVKPVQRINEALRSYGVEFELSEESSRVITRIIDLESGEVIRQIPGEAVLRVAERLQEFKGLLIREQG